MCQLYKGPVQEIFKLCRYSGPSRPEYWSSPWSWAGPAVRTSIVSVDQTSEYDQNEIK